MELLKRRGRPPKYNTPPDKEKEQNIAHEEVSKTITRAEADRRKIGVLTRMMAGDSFIVRRI